MANDARLTFKSTTRIEESRYAMAFSEEGQAMNKNLLVKTIQTMNQHLPN
ncbi:MAG: hypothetical protein MZV70_74505 [Desulfobacterales bacterium]|nr:hypothetical protein [Desulfobacterales bacterium]